MNAGPTERIAVPVPLTSVMFVYANDKLLIHSNTVIKTEHILHVIQGHDLLDGLEKIVHLYVTRITVPKIKFS